VLVALASRAHELHDVHLQNLAAYIVNNYVRASR
jgi:hypothetical protein